MDILFIALNQYFWLHENHIDYTYNLFDEIKM